MTSFDPDLDLGFISQWSVEDAESRTVALRVSSARKDIEGGREEGCEGLSGVQARMGGRMSGE